MSAISEKTQKCSVKKSGFLVLAALVLIFAAFGGGAAWAQSCCSCENTVNATEKATWKKTNADIVTHVTNEFMILRMFISMQFMQDNIFPAMMLMAEQLSAVAVQQVQIIGTFMDAKHQMETQRVFQKLDARAHKDYHPSVGMCEFGTNVKSLAASERKAEFNAVLMSQRAQDRALGNAYTSAVTGEDSDMTSRIQQFKEKFCDPMDNDNGLEYMCGGGASDPERKNKDIDFVRTVEAPWTLNIDFTDEALTDHEEEVLALASNLYGHHIFRRPPSSSLEGNSAGLSAMQEHYMDMRSVLAKRSVAENSFNAITAMKSQGSPGSREFMEAVLTELGMQPTDADLLFGDDPSGGFTTSSPSYYAQMEVLTKKIYQNPDFYTNLYDKPANVNRKAVALQAIGLMQKFDLYKSYLRNEASMSVLLELAVSDLQGEVENELGRLRAGGDPAKE